MGRKGVGGAHASAACGAPAQNKPEVGMRTDVAMHMQPAQHSVAHTQGVS